MVIRAELCGGPSDGVVLDLPAPVGEVLVTIGQDAAAGHPVRHRYALAAHLAGVLRYSYAGEVPAN